MSVLLPNTTAAIRRCVDDALDDYGGRVTVGWEQPSAFYDARTKENSDGTWALGVDPALWPVRVGDLVVTADGSSFLVKSAELLRNNFDSSVDWVRVVALQRSGGGTERGGQWSAGRVSP